MLCPPIFVLVACLAMLSPMNAGSMGPCLNMFFGLRSDMYFEFFVFGFLFLVQKVGKAPVFLAE
jgi:hypothetical protein